MGDSFRVEQPAPEGLPAPLAAAARAVAERLAEIGHRGWIVGGAVRDLALGRPAYDVDMVSAARPEEVEAAFEHTVPVGRAFGTVLVVMQGIEVQLTTFRSESGYTDARRPDAVEYGDSVEEDATRRDFTCNALFLDPLTGEVRDPAGGLTDLAAGRLATVGDAAERFREDGLRLLRMARFLAGLNLAPAEGLFAAAREAHDSLRGVSAERVLEELSRLCDGPRAAHGFAVLDECGLLERALPEWRELAAGCADWDTVQSQRLQALAALPDPLGRGSGFAVLLECDPLRSLGDAGAESALETSLAFVEHLRASRALRSELGALWRGRREIEQLIEIEPSRGERALALRGPHAPAALRLALAWAAARADADALARLDALEDWRSAQSEESLFPVPLLQSSDLDDAGIDRGPRWGELLRAAQREQLDGALTTREDALAWLALQDGGKTLRNPKASG